MTVRRTTKEPEGPAVPRKLEQARELVYTQAHAPEGSSLEEPGAYPFTRGIHATGYRGRLWTMRQYAGFATAAESNRRYRYLLDQGITGLS